MLKTWKFNIYNRKTFGALLTGLSKVFDYLPHNLLIAKLNSYEFSITAIRLVQNYPSNRKQTLGKNFFFFVFGVPQWFILGP